MAPLETKVIFQAPILHFHDYERKGTLPKFNIAPEKLPSQ